MDSTYFDEIHKKEITLKTVLCNVGLIVAAILLSFIFMLFSGFLQSFTLLLIVGAWVGAIYLIRTSSKEYEYILTDGEIDVDVISGMSRRKRIITIKPEQVTAFEKFTPDCMKRLSTPDVKKNLDLSSGNPHNSYVVTANINSTKTLIVISPSERLLEAWKPHLRKRRILL